MLTILFLHPISLPLISTYMGLSSCLANIKSTETPTTLSLHHLTLTLSSPFLYPLPCFSRFSQSLVTNLCSVIMLVAVWFYKSVSCWLLPYLGSPDMTSVSLKSNLFVTSKDFGNGFLFLFPSNQFLVSVSTKSIPRRCDPGRIHWSSGRNRRVYCQSKVILQHPFGSQPWFDCMFRVLSLLFYLISCQLFLPCLFTRALSLLSLLFPLDPVEHRYVRLLCLKTHRIKT